MDKKTEKLFSSPDEALKLQNQLCFPLYAASRKVVGSYTPYLKPLGITYTQYITFMVLWEQDDIPVGDICQRLHLDNGTVTPLLKKMEDEGFITRVRDEADERKVRIRLTKAGRAMKEKVKDIPAEIGGCFRLSREDARSLYRILYQILDN
jgi:DNA-binding MarR family transcriptional regulator